MEEKEGDMSDAMAASEEIPRQNQESTSGAAGEEERSDETSPGEEGTGPSSESGNDGDGSVGSSATDTLNGLEDDAIKKRKKKTKSGSERKKRLSMEVVEEGRSQDDSLRDDGLPMDEEVVDLVNPSLSAGASESMVEVEVSQMDQTKTTMNAMDALQRLPAAAVSSVAPPKPGKNNSGQNSEVWAHFFHFKQSIADGGKNVKCKHCNCYFKYVSRHGPKALKGHLQKQHRDLLEREDKKDEKVKAFSGGGKKEGAPQKSRQGEGEEKEAKSGARSFSFIRTRLSASERRMIDRLFVLWCCLDMRPFTMRDDIGFNLFAAAVCPAYMEQSLHHSTAIKILGAVRGAQDGRHRAAEEVLQGGGANPVLLIEDGLDL